VTTPPDPLALLRPRSYVALLVLAAIIGVPVSAAAYFFLALVSKLQGWIFTDLPKDMGFVAEPLWWPVPPVLLAGVLVALTIRYLPGTGGHSPADGFKAGAGAPSPKELPGIVLAAFATLSLGVVLGPEAPLIALGGGLGVLAVRCGPAGRRGSGSGQSAPPGREKSPVMRGAQRLMPSDCGRSGYFGLTGGPG
jgi:H+/Cl- antiporter ClcA